MNVSRIVFPEARQARLESREEDLTPRGDLVPIIIDDDHDDDHYRRRSRRG